MDVIRLLRCENQCLERFLALSREFLLGAGTGDFSKLESFLESRDRTLRAMGLFHRTLKRAAPPGAVTVVPGVQAELAAIARERGELIDQVLKMDAEIVQRIESEQSLITEKLRESHRTHQSLAKFKSGWVGEAGRELDQTL